MVRICSAVERVGTVALLYKTGLPVDFYIIVFEFSIIKGSSLIETAVVGATVASSVIAAYVMGCLFRFKCKAGPVFECAERAAGYVCSDCVFFYVVCNDVYCPTESLASE